MLVAVKTRNDSRSVGYSADALSTLCTWLFLVDSGFIANCLSLTIARLEVCGIRLHVGNNDPQGFFVPLGNHDAN